jgi:hypothetical protein
VSGSYKVTVSAEACEELGFLQHSERRIETRVGDTARLAVERWSIVERRV